MDFTAYVVIKAVVLIVAAFIWGLYCGFTGRPLWTERHDSAEPKADQAPARPRIP